MENTKGLSIVGSSRNNGDREPDDFYATPSSAVSALLEREVFIGNVWECACGDGAISKVLTANGIETLSTDVVYRGYGEKQSMDFLSTENIYVDNIITNPPFKYALPFVIHAKKFAKNKVALLLKTVFLEGVSRYDMFTDTNFPLETVYQFCGRISMRKPGLESRNSGMMAFAWFVWNKHYEGKPKIEWIR